MLLPLSTDMIIAVCVVHCDENRRHIQCPNTQVAKLCALAHIELVPEGGGENSESLDVAAVQRDVGAMLRCMQTMRRERVDNGGGGDGSGGHHSTGENRGGGGEEGEEERDDGPWGGAVPWAAPLQEVGEPRMNDVLVTADGWILLLVVNCYGHATHRELLLFRISKLA